MVSGKKQLFLENSSKLFLKHNILRMQYFSGFTDMAGPQRPVLQVLEKIAPIRHNIL